MSAERSHSERIADLEEDVALFRISNTQLSMRVADVNLKVNLLREQMNIMETTVMEKAFSPIPTTPIIDNTTASSACGSVDSLKDPTGIECEGSFQQQQMGTLEEAIGIPKVSPAVQLDKMTRMHRSMDEQGSSNVKQESSNDKLWASNDELKTTEMKERVSNIEGTCQVINDKMSDLKLGCVTEEYQPEVSKDSWVMISGSTSTSAATTASLPVPLLTPIDPFMSDVSSTSISIDYRNLLSEALFNTAKRGNAQRIRQFVVEGADFSYRNMYGHTALHIAAVHNHVDVLRTLVKLGAPLEARDLSQQTALHIAAWRGHENCVETLLLAGASINARDMGGRMPLHEAAQSTSVATVEKLIAAGADPEVKDNFDHVPKDYARGITLHAFCK